MLDTDTCYRALASRDSRFDGRFFTAVVTTGVYCRPVCPARTPRRRNVRFFPSAAAAEEAGFRPCRRCRPESSPGTPAWQGTSATVSRALGLIARGDLDSGDVEELATRLGVGSRHLRRLFLEHLGASPIALAQTRRAHFAKRLVDETRLPMVEVALASGFSSIRRFNDAMHHTYGRSPRELRSDSRRREEDGAGAGADLELRLPFRPPLDWDGLIDFLAPRAIPGVESVDRGEYRRTIEVDGFRGAIRVRLPRGDESFAVLSVPVAASRSLLGIVDRVRRLFDLDADPREIASHLAHDPRLARALRGRPGIRVPGAWDGFELAVRAILGQQVSVRGATTLCGRLVRLLGDSLPGSKQDALTHLFPGPGALAQADLSTVGIPGARQESLRALARAVRDGEIDLNGSIGVEETTARLVGLPGVGPWTAQYVALRALREPDAFPSGDLGLRRAFEENGSLPSARALEVRAQAWRPWRAYAAVALWAAAPRKHTSSTARRTHGSRTHRH